MKYTYLGDRLTDPALKGLQCNAVLRPDGKCIVSPMGTMLVEDEHGNRYNVMRRMLRLNSKLQAKREAQQIALIAARWQMARLRREQKQAA